MIAPRAGAASRSPAEILARAQHLIQQGDLEAARSELTRALATYPRDAGLHNLLGVAEAQLGNYPGAESNFKKAIEEAPRFAGAYLNLGRLYQGSATRDSHALDKGLSTYQTLLGFEPNNIEARYQSAVLFERRGSFQASLDQLSRLPAPDQEHAQALSLRCADYASLGEESQAEAAAARLLERHELTEADVTSILPILEAHQRNDLELRLLEGLAARGLASPGALNQLGVLYQRRGRLDQARETLETVAQAQPNSATPLVELAQVANQQNDRKSALGYLAHARDLEPRNASIHFFFGMVCVEENLAQEAYKSLEKAVSLDPTNAYYNYAMGSVAVERDDPREALPYFQKYCELKPTDPRGRLALGAAYFYSKDYDLARRKLGEAAKSSQTASGAHYFLGRIANQEGKLIEAADELELAVAGNPNYADAYAELGRVRLNQKHYALAEKALDHALELDPNSYTANLSLLILYQRTHDSRADAQALRFDENKKQRAQRAKEFLRTIEVRP
jgi:tetratricopeptide (TPR) repeat protein